jgi:hypothetical protein
MWTDTYCWLRPGPVTGLTYPGLAAHSQSRGGLAQGGWSAAVVDTGTMTARVENRAAGRMGAHQWGYPWQCSQAAGSQHQQARQCVMEADEVLGEQHRKDAKLVAATVGPEGG